MFSDRLLAIFELMAAKEGGDTPRGLLCAVASDITEVRSAGIALAVDRDPLICFCASDEVTQNLIHLENTVGEGPCHDALNGDGPVTEEDLSFALDSKWMLFSPLALGLGVRGVFCFPIRIGAIRLGVMCLYQKRPGQLSESQTADAMLMASVIGRGIVALQAGAQPGSLSNELQREAAFDFTVHQAAGMLSVQASIDISTSLVALRMHAFSLSEDLSSVCARVVNRQLRFDAQLQDWREG